MGSVTIVGLHPKVMTSSLQASANDVLEFDSVSRKLSDSFRQFVVGHLVFVHLPTEDLLVHLNSWNVEVFRCIEKKTFKRLNCRYTLGKAATHLLFHSSIASPKLLIRPTFEAMTD